MPRKIDEDFLDTLLMRIKTIYEEKRPRGDLLELGDQELLAEFPRMGITANKYDILDFLKRSLDVKPRFMGGRWLSYNSGISSVTIESIPPPEKLEWFAAKASLEVGNRLQERMRTLSWQGFAQFVKDILEQGSGVSLENTDRSHDGGIDFRGLKEPRKGYEFNIPVLIVGQAKRWTRKAKREDIAAFVGNVDMAPLPGKKQGQVWGIYINTGGFMEDARVSAPRSSLKLTLLDAQDLASLMITRKIGIRNRRLEFPVWDESFWNDYK